MAVFGAAWCFTCVRLWHPASWAHLLAMHAYTRTHINLTAKFNFPSEHTEEIEAMQLPLATTTPPTGALSSHIFELQRPEIHPAVLVWGPLTHSKTSCRFNAAVHSSGVCRGATRTRMPSNGGCGLNTIVLCIGKFLSTPKTLHARTTRSRETAWARKVL